MRPLADVQREVLGAVATLPVEAVPLAAARGLVLADDVVAGEAVPPFANSAMDGYAVRAADTTGATDADPVALRVVGELPAGRAPTVPVGAGEAIRIMTGAPMPEGADAIVMVERTTRQGDDGVLVHAPASPGEHLRAAGGDVEQGDVVFTRGTTLSPAHIGVLASIGVTEPRVVRRARVGVLSTGDELREGPVVLAPGQIRDSNRPMLLALVADAGAEPVDLGLARDDEALVARRIEDAVARCDALVTSGGVSVGDYDVVKAVLDRMGVLQWSQVAIKPAKPFAFGAVGGIPVFGLPGNPVSSHVSFELFARPALLTMMGRTSVHRPVLRAVAGAPMPRRPDGKLYLDRVALEWRNDGTVVATRSGVQASNALAAMANATGLALVPDGDGIGAGDPVDVMLLTAEPPP